MKKDEEYRASQRKLRPKQIWVVETDGGEDVAPAFKKGVKGAIPLKVKK